MSLSCSRAEGLVRGCTGHLIIYTFILKEVKLIIAKFYEEISPN